MIRNIVIIIILISIEFFLLFEFITAPFRLEADYLVRILILDFLAIILFGLRTESIKQLNQQYFKMSFFFLLGFCIVHYQIYIDYIFGNYSRLGYDFLIDKSIVSKAIVGSSIALLAFLIGYLIYSEKKKYKTMSSKSVGRIYPIKGLLFLSFLLFFAFLLTVDFSYFAGNYGTVDLGLIATYSQNYFVYSFLGLIIIKTWNLKAKNIQINSFYNYVIQMGVPILILLCMYFPLVILSGDRGPVIQISIVYFAGYIVLSKRKVRFQHVAVFLFVAISFLSFLGVIRAMQSGGDFFSRIENVNEARTKLSSYNSFSPNTMELAGVVRTYHTAVSYTEENGFSWGVFQAYQVLGIIPGFGTLFKHLTGLETEHIRSADFLTSELGADHGMGTTCVADIYLDFGVFGALFGFLMFGIFIRYLEERTFITGYSSLFTWVMVLTFFAFSVYLGRSSIMSVFRDCVLIYLIIQISFAIGKLFLKDFTKEIGK